MGSGSLTVEVKRQEMVSADCPTAGDSWVAEISWLGSSGGMGENRAKHHHSEDPQTHQCSLNNPVCRAESC